VNIYASFFSLVFLVQILQKTTYAVNNKENPKSKFLNLHTLLIKSNSTKTKKYLIIITMSLHPSKAPNFLHKQTKYIRPTNTVNVATNNSTTTQTKTFNTHTSTDFNFFLQTFNTHSFRNQNFFLKN